MDKKNTFELLEYILFSISLIEERMESITSSSDFIDNTAGLEKLDAVSMRLQTIGEALKNMMKTTPDLLYTQADKTYWSNIVKFREIISHHYIDIDSEIVFDICEEELSELKQHIIDVKDKLS